MIRWSDLFPWLRDDAARTARQRDAAESMLDAARAEHAAARFGNAEAEQLLDEQRRFAQEIAGPTNQLIERGELNGFTRSFLAGFGHPRQAE